MQRYLSTLKKCTLFRELDEASILTALGCLGAKIRQYKKDDTIFYEDKTADFLAVLLEGEVKIQSIDYHGNCNIISKIYPSDTIAAAAAFSSTKRLPFSVVCACEVTVLSLDYNLLTRPCKSACGFHQRIIQNSMMAIADKNIFFAQKIQLLTKRTIREKVLSYLYSFARLGKTQFTIPLSRKQMAEFLSVDRCALSRELSALKRESLIDYKNNSFTLL